MNEDVQLQLEDAKDKMSQSVSHLRSELIKLRAGKANPHMLDGLKVDYYGAQTPLKQVANVGTQDASTIVIQPWDKTMIEIIEKEIMKANLGFTPVNNGELIHINVPPLTEERRKDLVKLVKTEGENTKVSIRNSRREAMEGLKELKNEGLSEDETKRAEDEVQKLTDEYVKEVDKVMEEKEKDIMTV